MKSLNDSLREEFAEILNEEENIRFIKEKKLDEALIAKAFERLLSNKILNDETLGIDKARSDFETYIINTLKTKSH